MKKLVYAIYSTLTGKNSANAPKELIQDQLTDKRPLPTGRTEFEEWSDRIISGAMLPADADSQKFALANDLMHCSPNTAFETDVYFIHRLRKYAVNQVADAVRTELRDKAKARLAAEEAKQKQGEVTPATGKDETTLAEVQNIR